MKRACILHDKANLFILPVLGALTAAGALGFVDPGIVSVLFTAYVLIDFFWILLEPEAVPSLPTVILAHHIVTIILLSFPLRYAHLGIYTCWDGLCEINTFFLIARRQWKSIHGPLSALYWGTFFPSRIFLYPYLLVAFYKEMQQHAPWELVVVCACQLLLILFNFALLGLSILNWKKRASKARRAPGKTFAPSVAALNGGLREGKAAPRAAQVVVKAEAVTSHPKTPTATVGLRKAS